MAYKINVLLGLAILFLAISTTSARVVRVTNSCSKKVWPGLEGLLDGTPLAKELTGFVLEPNESKDIIFDKTLTSGRVWARTGCEEKDGAFKCLSGDCGTGELTCNGLGGTSPATLAEFTLDDGADDFYDISNVDGYNLPVSMVPLNYSDTSKSTEDAFNCKSVSCSMDAKTCPPELQAVDNQGNVVCYSLCAAVTDENQRKKYSVFQEIYSNKVWTNKVCCSCGDTLSPWSSYCGSPYNVDDPAAVDLTNYCQNNTWPLTSDDRSYTQIYHDACSTSYSWAYDDHSSTFQCINGNYEVFFCPGDEKMTEDDGTVESQELPQNTLSFSPETPLTGKGGVYNYETDARYSEAVSNGYRTDIPTGTSTGTPTGTVTPGNPDVTATTGTPYVSTAQSAQVSPVSSASAVPVSPTSSPSNTTPGQQTSQTRGTASPVSPKNSSTDTTTNKTTNKANSSTEFTNKEPTTAASVNQGTTIETSRECKVGNTKSVILTEIEWEVITEFNSVVIETITKYI